MLDRRGRIDIVASQAHGVRERTGLTYDQTDRAAWTVSGDVSVGGPRGVALMVAIVWRTRLPLLLWKLPFVPAALDRLYEVIARHRGRFPGETPWCVAHPDDCVPRED